MSRQWKAVKGCPMCLPEQNNDSGTVRRSFTIPPDRSYTAGPGAYVYCMHGFEHPLLASKARILTMLFPFFLFRSSLLGFVLIVPSILVITASRFIPPRQLSSFPR